MRIRNLLAAGAISAITIGGSMMSSAPAHAGEGTTNDQSGIRIVAQGQTGDGGWVEYTGVGEISTDDTSDGAETMAAKEVGGGIWSYGATYNLAGRKACYSQYRHGEVEHGSSVAMNGRTDSDWVGPGAVSSARLAEYTTATCRAYWSK
jgi:hypothetical protein